MFSAESVSEYASDIYRTLKIIKKCYQKAFPVSQGQNIWGDTCDLYWSENWD